MGQAIRAVLRPYDPEGDRIVYDGGKVRTDPNAVSVIGLALHELATNASKYGALSRDSGRVSIGWRHEQDRHGRNLLIIDWRELGGPPVAQPLEGAGTGFDIVETLLQLSRGSLDREWRPEGLRAVVTMPIGSRER